MNYHKEAGLHDWTQGKILKSPEPTITLSEHAAQLEERDAAIAARDSEIQELTLKNEEWVRIVESNRKEIVECDRELTKMVDRWRSQGSQPSINASGRRNCANDLAALLLTKKVVR